MLTAESSNQPNLQLITNNPNNNPVVFTPGTKLKDVEKAVILETLKQQHFNRTHTARTLGIGIRTLQRKLKKYGVSHWGLREDMTA